MIKRTLAFVAMIAVTSTAFGFEEPAPAFAGGQSIVTEGTIVYDNNGTVQSALSSADLTATWGDVNTMTDTGVLDDFTVGIFNSASGGNTGQIITGDVTASFFEFDAMAGTFGALIGSFTGGFDLSGLAGGGLDPGFFTTVSFSGLAGLGIDLAPHTTIGVTHTLSALTGGTLRTGIVSSNPPIIGTSDPTGFIDASDIGSGPGFFTLTGGAPIDTLYQIGVIPVPEPASVLTVLAGFFGVAVMRRRK